MRCRNYDFMIVAEQRFFTAFRMTELYFSYIIITQQKPGYPGFIYTLYQISVTLLIISLAITFSARKPAGVRLTVLPS